MRRVFIFIALAISLPLSAAYIKDIEFEERHGGGLKEICHDGVVYLFYVYGRAGGGMTIKRNLDNSIVSCES